MYYYDTNMIHAVHITSRHTGKIVEAWKNTFNILKNYDEAPNIYILYNEYSYNMKQTFNKAPPHVHIHNVSHIESLTLSPGPLVP